MNRQIVLDTETTGLDPQAGHRIIEIACLEIMNRRITGNHFHRYINPGRPIDRGAEEVHGLTIEFLQDKPSFNQIIADLLDFVKNDELVIHNAPFDVGFINHELRLAGHIEKKISDYCSILDTLTLARRKHPGQHNNLDALCKRYHVDNSNRSFHGALLDTELLAKVYLNMTGGQAHLFSSEIEITTGPQTQNSITAKRTQVTIPILYATTEELQAHQQFLAEILSD